MDSFKSSEPTYWATETAIGVGASAMPGTRVVTEQEYLDLRAVMLANAVKAKSDRESSAIAAARTLNLDDAQIAVLFPHLATALART